MEKVRRWVRLGALSLLTLLIVIAGVLAVNATRVPSTPARRDAEWGVEHVNGYAKSAKLSSVFGRSKRKSGSGGVVTKRHGESWHFGR